jgi:hypothetical protein
MSPKNKLLIFSPADEPKSSIANKDDELSSEKNELSSGLYDATSGGAEPAQSCVVTHEDLAIAESPKKKKKKQDKEEPCEHQQIKITSGKETRTVAFKGTSADALQLVSGYDQGKQNVTVELLGLAGPCGAHKNKTIDVKFFKQSSSAKLDFDAESVPFYRIFDNGTLFPWKARKAYYNINTHTCDNGIGIGLYTFPDISMSLDIPLSFGQVKGYHDAGDKKNDYQSIEERTKDKDLSIKASYTEDGHKWEVSTNIQKKFNKVTNIATVGENALKKLRDAFGGAIDVDFIFPKGDIHLDFSYKQFETADFRADYEYHVNVSLNPLVGAKATFHIDELALHAMTGPGGTFYSKLKRQLEDHGIKFGLDLIITGQLIVEISLKKEIAQEQEKSFGAGLTGKIEADLKAHASVEVGFIITIAASAEAGVKSGIQGTVELYRSSDVYLVLTPKFLGIIFYYQVSVEAGTKEQPHPNLLNNVSTKKNLKGSWGKEKKMVKEAKWEKKIQLS